MILDDSVRKRTFRNTRLHGEWAPLLELYRDGLYAVVVIMGADKLKLTRALLAWVISDGDSCTLTQDIRLWSVTRTDPPIEAMMVTHITDTGLQVVTHDYTMPGVEFDEPTVRVHAGEQLDLIERAIALRRTLANTTTLEAQVALLDNLPEYLVRVF